MAKHKYEIIIGQVRLDLAFEIVDGVGTSSPSITGRLLVFPRRWKPRHISVYFQPNPDMNGECTPHLTPDRGPKIWLPTFTVEQISGLLLHMQRITFANFLAHARLMSDEEVAQVGVWMSKDAELWPNLLSSAAKHHRWTVTEAKVAALTGEVAEGLELVPLLEAAAKVPGRPFFGVLVHANDELSDVTVGYFPLGLPLEPDGPFRDGGWYQMPQHYLELADLPRVLAPCGPGFWQGLRQIACFLGQSTEKLDELEALAAAARADAVSQVLDAHDGVEFF
jgi:hypothetical protein